jgi:hypothetical protein
MAKQVINIGAVANDEDADDLRTGGDMINDNFDELYALPTTIAGTCTTARTTAAKVVTIADYTLRAKDTLAITFTDGFSVNNATLNVNGGGAINIRAGAVNVTTALLSVAAATSFTINLYYDGTYFYIPGSQLNTNTTYSEISEAEITAGTASTARSLSGRRSEFIVTKARTGLQETLVSGTSIKTVNSNSLLGSGDISISGSVDINGTTEKTTPVDADVVLIEDSAATWAKKKLSWANIKATLKTYFDTLYVALSGATFTGTITTPSITLPTNGQILLTIPSTDGHATGNVTNAFNSGYSSSAIGDLVYLDSSSTWQKCDMDTSAATYSGLLGIALEVKASGNALRVALSGSFVYASAFPALTVGGIVYMSDAGAITQTQPSGADDSIRMIGWAVHADKIYFYPSPDYIVHT